MKFFLQNLYNIMYIMKWQNVILSETYILTKRILYRPYNKWFACVNCFMENMFLIF